MNGARTTDTASEKLWKEMDRLVSDPRSGGRGYGDRGSFFGEREMMFMNLLKDAYDNDLELIVACTYDTQASTPGRLMAKQGFLEVDGMRFFVCFTSEKRAREAKYNTDWNIMKARDGDYKRYWELEDVLKRHGYADIIDHSVTFRDIVVGFSVNRFGNTHDRGASTPSRY